MLPGIKTEHIKTIEREHHGINHQKMVLFTKWLQLYPGTTWSNVYDALVNIDKVVLARSLVKVRNQSASDTGRSPMSLPHTQTMPEQDFLLKKSCSAPTVDYVIIHTTLLYRLMQAIWQVLFEQIQVKS